MAQRKSTARKPRASRSSGAAARQSLGREDWIAAARAELITAGINSVNVERLARRLRVTRGSFYWHFKSHKDLLRELLESWEQTNTGPFERALTENGAPNGVKEFLTIINLWVEETDYSPAFDTAVRDWARTSPEVATAVRRVDERRIEVLHRVFLDMGFVDPEALIRARVAYFHQVGYYALQIRDEPEIRRTLVPLYCQVLLGSSQELIRAAFPAPACAEPAKPRER
jgi:AcrR family transcriptional regulator